MRDQWGIDLDLGLIRAGMIATSLSAGHHSFHEVMRGAQSAPDSLPGGPALDSTTTGAGTETSSRSPNRSCATTWPGTASSPTSTPEPCST